MPYSSVATVKAFLNVPAGDTGEDDAVTAALSAADAQIENYTGRVFTIPAATTAREVVPYTATVVRLPSELDRDTSVVVKTDTTGDGTFDTTLTDADWFLVGDTAPYREIVRRGGSWPVHANGRASVEVTGYYGYDNDGVPAPIVQASTMLAARLYQRHGSPLGFQAGVGGDFGAIRIGRGLDPDVAALLGPYKRAAVG